MLAVVVTDALGAHLQLVGALLTAHIEYVAVGHVEYGLKGERAFADAGLAA